MTTRCGACGKQLESGETIDVAGQGPRCYSCFNQETADRLGIDFDEPQFQPIVLEDADGRPHTFRFRSMLVPTGHEMEALETIDDSHEGYRFAILGDFEADPWELFRRLHAKMRAEIATRHVERTELGWHSRRTSGSSAASNGIPIVTPAFRWSSSTASRSHGSRSGTCS